FAAIRAPARFSVLVIFGLCVLAAIAIRELLAPRLPFRTSHPPYLRVSVVRVLVVAAMLEWLHLPPNLVAAPALHTHVGQCLARVHAPVVERARFADGTVYELAWTPELESRLAATSAIEPPAAGAIPFRIGELARYSVQWGGAGVNLSAGDIAIGVEAPEYHFV